MTLWTPVSEGRILPWRGLTVDSRLFGHGTEKAVPSLVRDGHRAM
jgi:hypothetical protein